MGAFGIRTQAKACDYISAIRISGFLRISDFDIRIFLYGSDSIIL